MLDSYANILRSDDFGRTIVGYYPQTYHSQTITPRLSLADYYSTMIAVLLPSRIREVLEQSSELLAQMVRVRNHLVRLNYSISLETNPYEVASRLTVFG
jgi:hypothetical protein